VALGMEDQKTVREEVLEYLEKEAGGCARMDEIAANVRRNVKSIYAALEKLARKGYIKQKIDRENMRRRIYCINRDRGKIEPREVGISV